MNESRLTAPFRDFSVTDQISAPLYLVAFDKDGTCESPDTLQTVHSLATSGRFSDVHIYSHGWNNVYQEATAHYVDFFNGYFELRRQAGLAAAAYKPLLIGVIWPSTAFLSDEEEAPRLAGAAFHPSPTAEDLSVIEALKEAIDPADIPKVTELLNRVDPLDREEAVELARILIPLLEREGADLEGIPQKIDPEKLVDAWKMAADERAEPENEGEPAPLPDGDRISLENDARPAGVLGFLNPKDILRKLTVYLMKDRAGTVGSHGVGLMLKSLLADSKARIHLAGHSFGTKVVLSALSFVEHPRKVDSVLLLQPAINAFCFAPAIQENDGRPGAFRQALEKTEMPIFSTFSAHDLPLTKFFHIALRRRVDIGEGRAAGPPDIFAALGGYGCGGMLEGESRTLPLLAATDKYDLSDPHVRFYSLDGSEGKIMSHGDVRNPFTAWAMITLVSGGDLP